MAGCEQDWIRGTDADSRLPSPSFSVTTDPDNLMSSQGAEAFAAATSYPSNNDFSPLNPPPATEVCSSSLSLSPFSIQY